MGSSSEGNVHPPLTSFFLSASMRRSLGPRDRKKLFLMDVIDLKLISEEELDAMTDDVDEGRED